MEDITAVIKTFNQKNINSPFHFWMKIKLCFGKTALFVTDYIIRTHYDSISYTVQKCNQIENITNLPCSQVYLNG